ncbi:MAG TPA: amino acid permease [Gemmataceae bacterium]|nr:amino acid permease [Gemmataceae bacterium]
MKPDTPSPQPGLVRALGPLMATAVVVGTVIGSGIFKKPQSVAAHVPDFATAALVWVLGGVLALLGGLALAEIAVLYPKAGGNYVFLREGFGRLAGFLWGWVEFWIIRGASLAALATIFSESLHDILRNPSFQQTLGLSLGPRPLGPGQLQGLTVAVILALTLVNIRGVRWGGGLQLFITTIKVASLLAITVLPFVAWSLAWPVSPRVSPEFLGTLAGAPAAGFPANLPWGALYEIAEHSPPAIVDFRLVGTALLGVLWAYHGWMNIAPVAEEVRNPRKNIPLSLLAGIGIVIAVYLGANLAYHLVIPQYQMTGLTDTTVATDFCLRLLGPIGAAVASAAVMCSVFGALNGNLLVAPRLLYAMGEDGLAPRALGAIHPRYRTPARAIAVMGGWAALLVLAAAVLTRTRLPILDLGLFQLNLNVPRNKSLFDILTDFAMFGAIIFETMAVASIFVFRWRLPHVERPYRCPGYPVVPALYIGIMALVVVNTFVSQRTEAVVGVGFIAAGAVVYYLMFTRCRDEKDGKDLLVTDTARGGISPWRSSSPPG